MVFNSLTFLGFLAVVFALYRLPLSWRAKKMQLLAASYVFYAAWNPPFVALLAGSTLVDWVVAGRMAATDRRYARRALLLVSLLVNLGFLGFFKYGGFLLDNFTGLLAGWGIAYQPPELDIVLPVGISFYTFQTLSYTIDVYRGRLEPSSSLLDFALYVSFFPQLVAGPIVRAGHFLPQCAEPRRPDGDHLGWGFTLLTIGLFQKVILADAVLAPVADRVYGDAYNAGFADAWLGTLAFSGQIFFDFAGYSTCAIGVAMLLGFSLPDNFRHPYGAMGFSDFWRRWHVSLSSWLRDYLYISMGGNRKGISRTRVNLLLTMLLGGLWHGASWRFVVWGGLHGAFLVVERPIRARWGSAAWASRWYSRVVLVLLTYGLVCITWVFFRASDFDSAFALVAAMVLGAGENRMSLGLFAGMSVLVVNVWLVAGHTWMRRRTLEDVWGGMPPWLRAAVLTVLVLVLLFAPGDDRAFIYFQF